MQPSALRLDWIRWSRANDGRSLSTTPSNSGSQGGRQEDRRRLSREQGLPLLFAAAQDIARQKGALGEGIGASLEQSVLSRASFALKTQEGKLILRIPLQEVRAMLRYRQGLASHIASRSNDVTLLTQWDMDLRQRLRLCNEEMRALVWAISQGRRFPTPIPWSRNVAIGAIVVLLAVAPGGLGGVRLVLFLVPAVAYWIWLISRYVAYRKAVEDLIMRWRMNGKRDPDSSFFKLYNGKG